MFVFVFILREHPKAQPIVVLEKPGIEPATPGLQGIALTHYTTSASHWSDGIAPWSTLILVNDSRDYKWP